MHTLVLYGRSKRADEFLRERAASAQEHGERLTVLALVREEPEHARCCDMRTALWNEICHDLAREELTRAHAVVDGDEDVQIDVLVAGPRGAADTVAAEALERSADEIALADPHSTGLGPLERRRLRRRSPVPVVG